MLQVHLAVKIVAVVLGLILFNAVRPVVFLISSLLVGVSLLCAERLRLFSRSAQDRRTNRSTGRSTLLFDLPRNFRRLLFEELIESKNLFDSRILTAIHAIAQCFDILVDRIVGQHVSRGVGKRFICRRLLT